MTMEPLGGWYLVVMSLVIIFVIIFYFSLFKIDITAYKKYVIDLTSTAQNEPLLNLLTGNTLTNLPNIEIVTDNEYINALQECKAKATLMGPDDGTDYTAECKYKCGGAGELMVVGENDEYYETDSRLEPGIYCVLDPPVCNTNTSYVLATANSTACKSKYPNMFGGLNGNEIVACNDEKYPATGSSLWDFSNNEAVNPNTIVMTHEDELLPNGDYRFQCKFSETAKGNPYIAHPLNRFHPIPDKCNNTILRASYDVHADITDSSWTCNCGEYDTTRVQNLSSDPKSICTSCFYSQSVVDADKGYRKAGMPYLCFNQSSNFEDAFKYAPCLDLPTDGNACGVFEIEYKKGFFEVDGNYSHYKEYYGAYVNDFLDMNINKDYSRRILGTKTLHG